MKDIPDLTDEQLASAIPARVRRRRPEGPALALLRIAARHPRIIRGSARNAAWGVRHEFGSVSEQRQA